MAGADAEDTGGRANRDNAGPCRPRTSAEDGHKAVPAAHLVSFLAFLADTGRFAALEESCPLAYTSPNAPTNGEFLQTWILAILHGCQRYAHVDAMRGGALDPLRIRPGRLLGEDALRRGMAAIAARGGGGWLSRHIAASVSPFLRDPWMLDIDIIRQPIFEPRKRGVRQRAGQRAGCRAHRYQTYFMSGTRLVLGGDVRPAIGHDHLAVAPELVRILDELPFQLRPRLIRGVCEPGCDRLLLALEARRQPYLVELNLTVNMASRMKTTVAAGESSDLREGGPGGEAVVRLPGWSRSRRVVVLHHTHTARPSPGDGMDVVVLVTNLEGGLPGLGELLHESAHAGDADEETRERWRWGGFATEDLTRCQVAMLGVALIHNWWILFLSAWGGPRT